MKYSQSMFAWLLLTLGVTPQAAHACVDFAPFMIEDIRRTDVVLTGKPVAFERISPEEPDTLSDYGLLTVHVENVLKGAASGEVELYWWNSTFGVPETFETFDRVLIAAINSSSNGPPLRGPSATLFPTQRPDLLQILQAPCSQPFILPATREDDALFRAVLRGEPWNEAAYVSGRNLEFKTVPKKVDWWQQNVVPTSVMVIAGFLVVLVLIRRRRRSA